jgi:hypothetical protein
VETVVTARRDKAAALKLRKRVRENTAARESSSPTVFGYIPRQWMKSELRIGMKSVAISNRAENFIDRFDDSNSRCCDFDE